MPNLKFKPRVAGPALVLALLTCAAASQLRVEAASAAGDANKAACPQSTETSTGFVAHLPDCRAYELVTTPYKEGFEQFSQALAPDGNSMIVGSIGSYAGAEATSAPFEPNVYKLIRTATGWVPTPLSPKISSFPGAIYAGASRDLSTTVWEMHTPSQSVYTRDLYLRSPSGEFTEVGPTLPPAVTEGGPLGAELLEAPSDSFTYTGASAALSRIVFQLTAFAPEKLWPGDTTVGSAQSLYEYSGVHNAEPKLVGVSNAHKSGSHVNEEVELISDCGTFLGSGHDAYNAVADSGTRVFFTPAGEDLTHCEGKEPAMEQLYARNNGTETVQLSSRSQTECTGECATSEERDANFAGASADGSVVYFTSTQELVNGATQDPQPSDNAFFGCTQLSGVGGCNLYAYDFDASEGHQLSLVAAGNAAEPNLGVQGVTRVSPDGSHVYFVDSSILAENENSEGQKAATGAKNLYVYVKSATGTTTSFVARLNTPPSFERCSELEEEGKGQEALTCEIQINEDVSLWKVEDQRPATTTRDGRFLVFANRAHLTSDDTSREENGEPLTQLFEYDSVTGQLSRVSIGQLTPEATLCPQTGLPDPRSGCDGNITSQLLVPKFGDEIQPNYVEGSRPTTEPAATSVSSDGSTVLFESAALLAPNAVASKTPGCGSIFEYHNSVGEGGSTAGGEVYLVSDGKDVTKFRPICGAHSPKLDQSGENAFFESGDPLVAQATDTQHNFFDARINGGFALPAEAGQCAGNACQGPFAGAPMFSEGSTAHQSPGDNVAPSKVVTSRTTPLSRLMTALRRCRTKHVRAKRRACEAQARKAYRAALRKSHKKTAKR